jgi:hypothetical protein
MKKLIRAFRILMIVIIAFLSAITIFAAVVPRAYAQTITPITGVTPVDVNVKAETLSMAVAAILSLLFSYFPGLNTWYAGVSKEIKSTIMIGLLVLTALIIYFGSCLGLFNAVTCDQQGLWTLTQVFFFALIANQSTFQISPPTQLVRIEKAIVEAAVVKADKNI